jgi:RNase H-fold protein (predicted Holliday junction resolvase)
VDERLTSFEAEEMLKEFQQDYKKRKKILDSISALVILRSYMEKMRNL